MKLNKIKVRRSINFRVINLESKSLDATDAKAAATGRYHVRAQTAVSSAASAVRQGTRQASAHYACPAWT